MRTHAITITSVAISVPAMILGGWLTEGIKGFAKEVSKQAVHQTLKQALKETLKSTAKTLFSKEVLGGLIKIIALKTVVGIISETIEEIVVDGLVETFFQSLVTSFGGSADLGHWVSTLMTTARETKFFSSFFTTGGETSQVGSISQDLATTQATLSNLEQNHAQMSAQQITENLARVDMELDAASKEATLSLKKLLRAGLLVGLSLILPSLAGLNLYAITKTLGSTINQAYTSYVIKPKVEILAARSKLVEGIALDSAELMKKIPAFMQVKPVIDSFIETASPTIEIANVIRNPMSTSLSYNSFRAGVYYDRNDNLDGGYITEIDQKKETIENIKQHQKLLDDIINDYGTNSEIINIMVDLASKGIYSKFQMNRIKNVLVGFIDASYEGESILDSRTGKYGAINLNLLKYVEDKIDKGEQLNYLDYEIFKAKALLANNHHVFNGKYPPLYIQGEWDNMKENSRYYNHFKVFIDNLNGIILKEPTLKIYNGRSDSVYRFLSEILGYKIPGDFATVLDRLKLGPSGTDAFEVGEATLDKWYVRLDNFVKSKFGTSAKYQKIMSQIEQEFRIIYRKFGYEGIHPLYRDSRLTLIRIGEVLHKANVKYFEADDYTMTSFEKLMGDRNYRYIFRCFTDSPYGKPSKDLIISFVNKIFEKIKELNPTARNPLHWNYVKEILAIRDDYLGEIGSYLSGLDILKNYRLTYRKILIETILGNFDALQYIGKVYELSWILMGGALQPYGSNHLQSFLTTYNDMDKSPPSIYELLRILVRVSGWNKQMFSELGLIVSDEDIDRAKDKISMVVEKWVENAHKKGSLANQWKPYSPIQLSLLKAKSLSSAKYGMKYALINSLYVGCLIKTNNPQLTFEDIKDKGLLGTSKISLEDIIIGKHPLNKRFIRGALASIKSWINEEAKMNPRSRVIKDYFSLQKQIARYSLLNHMSIKGSGGNKIFNGRKFTADYIMGYHIFTAIGKHYGIDPLSLTIVNDKGFDPDIGRAQLKKLGISKWLRHHFLDSKIGRRSFLHSDTVLANNRNHFEWESLTETESLAILQGYEELIRMRGSGKAMKGGVNEITMDDINEVFSNGKGNEWIVARWLSEKKFEENLEEFNNRRRDMRLMGVEAFINKYYGKAYERFSKILEDGRDKFDAFLLELHDDLVANDLVSKDVFTVLNTYLRNEGHLSYLGSIV